ncbi:GlsB/YeaQ/YmgE family stress response membrane protein [Leeia oryzae]|uniref:GlsB/YeaQ/YmgE family stress response membrane protein n=1 Tax=Leeia oryzae TaxID=356662 RepID=UPI0003771B79|nr:GlsB/YeaQ/YmgE family stress response membrane protein [Leeia oryzae]
MTLLIWILLGLIAGFIASLIVSGSDKGLIMDIILGIVGAVLGGWIFSLFGKSGVTGLNGYSLLVAVVGAIVLLVLSHAFNRRFH